MDNIIDTPLDVAQILQRILGDCQNTGEFRARLGRIICDIDQRLSDQLTEIVDAPPFAELESAWRGVQSVVYEIGPDKNIKLRLLDFSWAEVSKDLNSASTIKDTNLYHLIGLKELETSGGEPFGITLIDHGLSLNIETDYDDLYTAQLLCDLGDCCACPVVMGVGRDFFVENDAAWVTDLRRINSILQSHEYESWHKLRDIPNARFLGLVWPDVLARVRYENVDVGFRFTQRPSQSSGLWQNGIYHFVRTIICEFRRCAWFGFLKLLTDQEGIGAVVAIDKSPIPKGTTRPAVGYIRATHGIGSFLSENGFIPLCESTKSGALYFMGNRSVANTRTDTALEVLTQLQSVLIACRMVHYIKVKIRALIGQIKTAAECELYLNNWLQNYCSNLAEAAPEILAKYPLRDAYVTVQNTTGGDGFFNCEIFIKPQYQIDHMMTEIKLSTDLGAANRKGL